VVVAIDAMYVNDSWRVFVHGGRTRTALEVTKWAKEVEALGAGELLLTSMDNDGTKNGFALDLINQVSQVVNIPIIASGGAGAKTHFKEVFAQTKATGGLAASIFHFNEITIPDLKDYLKREKIQIR